MAEPASGSPSQPPRTPAGRTTAAPTLESAMQRIAALEEKLARYEQLLAVGNDGSVTLNATGPLRLVSPNSLLLEAGGNWIELGITGMELRAPAQIELECSTLQFQAALLKNQAAVHENQGVVRCDTLIANSVVASSYTPGAGNVW